ncbi:hypothetical protein [Methylomonas sp. 11b]|uniref:hypothetical protein n=1 Tax=Methylomonas sp. 11b TaxID=1168169 RepID=UPI0012DC39F0|nr:hypothetical protein [Methylomonas sp. 11b]
MKKLAFLALLTMFFAYSLFQSNASADSITYALDAKYSVATGSIVSIPSVGNVSFSLLPDGSIDVVTSFIGNDIKIIDFGIDAIKDDNPIIKSKPYMVSPGLSFSNHMGLFNNVIQLSEWPPKASFVEAVFGFNQHYTSVNQFLTRHDNSPVYALGYDGGAYTLYGTAVPIPSGILMFASGLLAMGAFRMGRKPQ